MRLREGTRERACEQRRSVTRADCPQVSGKELVLVVISVREGLFPAGDPASAPIHTKHP